MYFSFHQTIVTSLPLPHPRPLDELDRGLLSSSWWHVCRRACRTAFVRCTVMQDLNCHQRFAESLTGDEKGGSCPKNCPDWLVKFIGSISGCASHDTNGMPCAKCQHACQLLLALRTSGWAIAHERLAVVLPLCVPSARSTLHC